MKNVALVWLAMSGVAIAAWPQQAPQSGLDVSSFDQSVRPQDDLFRYENGRWLATAEVSGDRAHALDEWIDVEKTASLKGITAALLLLLTLANLQ